MGGGGISSEGNFLSSLSKAISLRSGFTDEVLEKALPKAKKLFFCTDWWHLQDNAPIHMSKKTMDYLSQNVDLVIGSGSWPPNFDLNLIENVWTMRKENVRKRRPGNLAALAKMALDERKQLPQNYIKNSCQSMPQTREVLKANGEEISH